MKKVAPATLDVRAMRTLLVLLTECNVSRAAERLGQAQPTVSLALKRLREMLGDPLLVRYGGSLVPTERGLDLKVSLEAILSEIDARLTPHPTFDPAHSDRTFRLAANNCLGSVFLPPLVRTIRRAAPGVTVEVGQTPPMEDLLRQMAEGAIDAVIGNWPQPPSHLRISTLLSTDIVCVMRPNHRLARREGRIDLADFLAEGHLSPTSDRNAQLSPIDGRLIELGLKRRIAVTVPEYAMVPYMLAQSDLLFTTGRHFAEQIAQSFAFSLVDAPEELGRMSFYMLWHDCKHHSPAHAWLRRTIRSVAADIRALDPALPDTEARSAMPLCAV
ncbi:LysR substrate-binding domain-containing protein [Methylorubrum zatmanii]|uniref:LysR substrate-binding domain-containing protein n=1 Tax=Methylorubrum zatmanii TaxID=29429 RepID=A0ABW1WMM2_9HYPH|nr:LysR substrate-binding domain-containing protein [Methylorubrum zatmanii]MBD8908326.1 LysR family transcriptional regulator [Methylorubrum zatmanii]